MHLSTPAWYIWISCFKKLKKIRLVYYSSAVMGPKKRKIGSDADASEVEYIGDSQGAF